MIQIYSVIDLDNKLLNEIMEIDSLVYPKHLLATFDEFNNRFLANRDSFILLYDDGKLIGYMCLFPVKPVLYNRILTEDKLFDADITGDMIEQYRPHETYDLYLLSVAIRPEYQNRGLSKLLREGFFKYLSDKKDKGISFSSAVAVAISKEGQRLLEKIGFIKKKDITGGYILYELFIDQLIL